MNPLNDLPNTSVEGGTTLINRYSERKKNSAAISEEI